MNKLLIKVLLFCMMLTCLSSGTLAVYTTTLDSKMTTAVKAKSFYIGVNAADEFEIRLAPGDIEYCEFDITNTLNDQPTEVDMDLTIAADYTSLYSALPGVTVHLEELGSSLKHYAAADGHFEYKETKAFTAYQNKTRTFYMVFSWDENAQVSGSVAGRRVEGLSMYITGTQHVGD